MLLKIFRLTRFSFQMAVLTLLVFLVLNLFAQMLFVRIRTRGGGAALDQYFIPPLSAEGLAILERWLPDEQRESIIPLLASDPGIRPHPVLAFTEGFSTPGYEIGVESIRYEPGWSDLEVEEWLRRPGTASFVLGGSTAFGHGVEGSQTIAATLNRLLPDERFLNLAVQASDSQREVDLLLHLLRLGYRPARVIFVDGLNDLTTFSWSAYRAQDKPRTQTLLIDRGEVPLIPGHPRSNNMMRAFIFSLPVVQLIRHWGWQQRFQDYTLQEIRGDQFPLDWQELMFFYLRWLELQPPRADQLAEEWIRYYLENTAFVSRLGHEFGFEAHFVLQPIGPALPRNPFLRAHYLESELLGLYQTFVNRGRQAITSGRLPVTDCSSVLDEAVEESFVDAAHYSPRGNRLVAECIGRSLSSVSR